MQSNCTAIGLCSTLKMNQWLGSGVSQPIAGKPARMGRAYGYKMQAFTKTPQISSPSATTTRYSLFERIWRCGLHIGSAQQCSGLVRQSDEFAGESSSGKGFPSSEIIWRTASLLLSESFVTISEPVFCRFVLPCQILLPSIKTVGSAIRQRKILPIKLCFINVYTYPNPKPTLTVMLMQYG